MIFDIIVLSALRASPAHGYELKRRVQRPSFAALSNNSLYPALHRFEKAGAVTHAVDAQDGRPSRKVYTITELGRGLFHDLISSLPAAVAGNEEEFLIRLGFFDEVSAQDRAAILAARAAALDEKIAQVGALVATRPEREGTDWPSVSMAHLLSTLRHERDWVTGLMRDDSVMRDETSTGHVD